MRYERPVFWPGVLLCTKRGAEAEFCTESRLFCTQIKPLTRGKAVPEFFATEEQSSTRREKNAGSENRKRDFGRNGKPGIQEAKGNRSFRGERDFRTTRVTDTCKCGGRKLTPFATVRNFAKRSGRRKPDLRQTRTEGADPRERISPFALWTGSGAQPSSTVFRWGAMARSSCSSLGAPLSTFSPSKRCHSSLMRRDSPGHTALRGPRSSTSMKAPST